MATNPYKHPSALKSKKLLVAVTPAKDKAIRDAARKARKTLSDWLREAADLKLLNGNG